MTGILWAVVQSPVVLQPRFSNGQAHHVTLQYGVQRQDWDSVINLPVTIGAIEECWDDRVQALRVVLPTWVECQNPVPHMTISWADGVSPVEANSMFAGEHQSAPLSGELELIHCSIEWLEWGDSTPNPRQWAGRKPVPCPVCRRQGKTTLTRSITGHCRRHRNA